MRSSNYEHNHRYMEFPPFVADLIQIPVAGGKATVITSGVMKTIPQFTQNAGTIDINFADGLYEVSLRDQSKKPLLHVTGPTWYFVDGTAPADAIKISPDGHWALAQITQQLYLLPDSARRQSA